MKAVVSAAAFCARLGHGLAGPHRHRPVDLLTDEGRGPVGVHRPEHAGCHCLHTEVADDAGDVETDGGQLRPDGLPASTSRPLDEEGQPEERGMLVDPGQQFGDEALKAVDGIELVLPDHGDGLEQLRMHAVEAGTQQFLSVGEVDVDGRSGDSGFGRDLVHGHIGRAPLAEQSPGDLDDLLASVVADDLLQTVIGPAGHRLGYAEGRSGAAAGNLTGRCLTPLMN